MTSESRVREPGVTSRIMRSIRSRDTRPELALRRAVHAMGARYRVHPNDVFGHPDLVVRSRKLAVFVDGDLWHGNPAEWKRRGKADLASMFPSRTEWWVAKIERNVMRDRLVDQELKADGWRVLRLWASDVIADPDRAAETVVAAIRSGS